MKSYIYTFKNGDVVTSVLKQDELLKRMRRLDVLRVLTEAYEEGDGRRIAEKALRAYNKVDNFTGIIRLNSSEKDFLGYMLESDMLTDEDIETLNWYIHR